MTKKLRSVKVRRLDDGQEFWCNLVYLSHPGMPGEMIEDTLADSMICNGRPGYARDENRFVFRDEPQRLMEVIETSSEVH
ncbi:MAG TPA: hypothetical protein VGP76_32030 [Planctomycetaceae bacterium]|jgi:hypothetical protein|nr:hypothetical protein [Planctomycetaceae bacterium]